MGTARRYSFALVLACVTSSLTAQNMGSVFQSGLPGLSNTKGAASSVTTPAPQPLGPKAPGKIRLGIAPAQAQFGQGISGQADFGRPIRNSIVSMMSGPAVEVTPLDAHIPIQLEAEAQEKRCDYILLSTVTVRHSGTNFDKFMKIGSTAASFNPMVMMTKSMGALVAGQVAQAAGMGSQQQAGSQLASFNGQIKSKDDVLVDYQLFPTGNAQARLQNSLKGKAKSDGEDVLTPLIEQAATNILTEMTKK